MHQKKAITPLIVFMLVVFLVCPATAAMSQVQMFQDVNIPYDLVQDDITVKKGEYDIEIWAYREVRQWSLKIKKKGKTECVINGVVLRDACPGARGEEMEDVPEEATLKMSRIPAIKTLNFIFQAGSLTEFYTCYKVKFPIQYED